MSTVMKRILLIILAIIPSLINAQWTQTGFQQGSIFALHTVGNTIFAGNLAGLHRSTDNGQTWQLSISGVDNSQGWILMHTIASSSNYIFIGNYDGLYRSSNNGQSWSKMSLSLTTPQSDAVCSITCDGSTVYAGTTCGLFKSTNDGTNWTKLSNGISATQKVYAVLFSNSKLYLGTENGVFISSDNGTSFTQIGFESIAISSLTNTPYGVVAVTFRNGVHYTNDDGANWTAVNIGQNANIPAFTAITANSRVLFGTNGVTSVSNVFTNHVASGLNGKNILSLAVCGNYLFAGTNADGVWRIPLADITAITETKPTESLIKVFPNSAQAAVTVKFKQNFLKIVIYDISGKEVYADDLKGTSITIDVSKLPQGIYQIKLSGKGLVQAEIFVKQ
jgi:photosystem II stability/assembly factor-like uncharacterized protein